MNVSVDMVQTYVDDAQKELDRLINKLQNDNPNKDSQDMSRIMGLADIYDDLTFVKLKLKDLFINY